MNDTVNLDRKDFVKDAMNSIVHIPQMDPVWFDLFEFLIGNATATETLQHLRTFRDNPNSGWYTHVNPYLCDVWDALRQIAEVEVSL